MTQRRVLHWLYGWLVSGLTASLPWVIEGKLNHVHTWLHNLQWTTEWARSTSHIFIFDKRTQTLHTVFSAVFSSPDTFSLCLSAVRLCDKLNPSSNKECRLVLILPSIPSYCMFLSLNHHIHKTNVLSSVAHDESLLLCQITSSHFSPPPSYSAFHSLIFPPSSSTLLLTHSFIHSFSRVSCAMLMYVCAMCFKSLVGE